jgi:hypothetical protein
MQKENKVELEKPQPVQSITREAILSRLYSHRSTLVGILRETERMIDWLAGK